MVQYNPDVISLVCFTIFTLCVSIWRSEQTKRKQNSSNNNQIHPIDSEEDEEIEIEVGEKKMVIIFPIVGSIFLILLYYFPFISEVLIFFAYFSSFLAIYYSLYPLVNSFTKTRHNHYLFRIKDVGIKLETIILTAISVGIVAAWSLSSNPILNNVIGCTLCMTFISVVRIKNLKIISILLIALFIYDIFWVFYSSNLFGKNVMVEVAKQKASNPIHNFAEKLSISSPLSIELPVKLIFGKMVIGLGDIVVPGLLISMSRGFDLALRLPLFRGYFIISFSGYFLGLVCTLIAVTRYRVAQPALLYLVPFTLLPVVLYAIYRGEFANLWNFGNNVNNNSNNNNSNSNYHNNNNILPM